MTVLVIAILVVAITAVPAFAVTEEEVEAAVAASSKGEVAGNVLIWFLCAIAFLKVSQKIDSFMASLGVNVGRTGGSMLSEAWIAMRGISSVAGIFGGRQTGGKSSGTTGNTGFLKGGLAGVVSRKVTNDAMKTATTATSAVNIVKSQATSSTAHTAASTSGDTNQVVHPQSQSAEHTAHTDSQTNSNPQIRTEAQINAESVLSQPGVPVKQQPLPSDTVGHAAPTDSPATVAQPSTQEIPIQERAGTGGVYGQQSHSTSHVVQAATTANHREKQAAFKGIGLGGAIFARSLRSGGNFANDVIGRVATGDFRSAGSITGELAAQSLTSYLGYAAQGENTKSAPAFSGVEIGGGRITGIETPAGSSECIAFGMYHADQYTAPKGDYSEVRSTDGALWYKQYAQDAVERKPYMAPDDTVAYRESIVKKLPDPPKRKDRL